MFFFIVLLMYVFLLCKTLSITMCTTCVIQINLPDFLMQFSRMTMTMTMKMETCQSMTWMPVTKMRIRKRRRRAVAQARLVLALLLAPPALPLGPGPGKRVQVQGNNGQNVSISSIFIYSLNDMKSLFCVFVLSSSSPITPLYCYSTRYIVYFKCIV